MCIVATESNHGCSLVPFAVPRNQIFLWTLTQFMFAIGIIIRTRIGPKARCASLIVVHIDTLTDLGLRHCRPGSIAEPALGKSNSRNGLVRFAWSSIMPGDRHVVSACHIFSYKRVVPGTLFNTCIPCKCVLGFNTSSILVFHEYASGNC